MVIKEIHELRRDKVSISMVLLTPLFQLIILGYAINMDPHNLPTALLNYDTERMSQIFVTEAQNTGYFSMIPVDSEEAAQKAFVRGDVTFIVTIPEGFTRKLLRGEKPQLLIQGMPSIRSPRGMRSAPLCRWRSRCFSTICRATCVWCKKRMISSLSFIACLTLRG